MPQQPLSEPGTSPCTWWQPRLEQDRLEADEQGQRLWAETAGGWLIARATPWAEEEARQQRG
ncbi:hypothetical protein [Thermogemmatispora tikiterensis]|uniref:Uncharacterized protein n=1 Tax=Thermogemmatispora tikiterensis TaxID=1825093 RepID=A0A328VEE7_9CHLR|nr:hypothetical protein [Thermogemmatispora tikiterensis]RAQ93903.1 hypothetical protein A4R35_00060 [Thermogemmatispora tikiterensis]